MAQRRFDDEQAGLRVTGFDIDHPIGVDADTRQRECEQVLPIEHPYNRSAQAGENSGDKANGGGAMDEVRTSAVDLMHGA